MKSAYEYYVYILASRPNGTFYIGITSDLLFRVDQHKEKIGSKFTAKYNINMLVYYEIYQDVNDALLREKQLKKMRRIKKIMLIEKMNPFWKDMYYSLTA